MSREHDGDDEPNKALARTDDKKDLRGEKTEGLIEKLLDRLPWAILPATVIKTMARAVDRSAHDVVSATLFSWGLVVGAILSWLIFALLAVPSVITAGILSLSIMMATGLSFTLIPVRGRIQLRTRARLEQGRERFESEGKMLDERARSMRDSGSSQEQIEGDLRPLYEQAIADYLAVQKQCNVSLRALDGLAEPSNETMKGHDETSQNSSDS